MLKPGGRFVFAGEPTAARRLHRPPAVALHLVGGHPRHPAAAAGRRGGARRPSWTSPRARPRSRRSSTSTPSPPTRSRRSPAGPVRVDVRVATSELIASWFGWPVRTFECAVPREKLGMRWANFALKGWQRLSAVDAAARGRRARAGCSTTPRSPARSADVTRGPDMSGTRGGRPRRPRRRRSRDPARHVPVARPVAQTRLHHARPDAQRPRRRPHALPGRRACTPSRTPQVSRLSPGTLLTVCVDSRAHPPSSPSTGTRSDPTRPRSPPCRLLSSCPRTHPLPTAARPC